MSKRIPGSARLIASDVALEMELSEGRIVGVSGIDTSLLGRALNCEPLGEGDLIAEALALAAANEIPEATAMGAAKVAMITQAQGAVSAETLAAIPYPRFLEIMDEIA